MPLTSAHCCTCSCILFRPATPKKFAFRLYSLICILITFHHILHIFDPKEVQSGARNKLFVLQSVHSDLPRPTHLTFPADSSHLKAMSREPVSHPLQIDLISKKHKEAAETKCVFIQEKLKFLLVFPATCFACHFHQMGPNSFERSSDFKRLLCGSRDKAVCVKQDFIPLQ